MKHANMIDKCGRIVDSSQNLIFSCRWLQDWYLGQMKPKGAVGYNCSEKGILQWPAANLENKLKSAKQRKLSEQERNEVFKSRLRSIVIPASPDADGKLKEALKNNNVTEVVVNHITSEDLEWIQSIS